MSELVTGDCIAGLVICMLVAAVTRMAVKFVSQFQPLSCRFCMTTLFMVEPRGTIHKVPGYCTRHEYLSNLFITKGEG